MDNKKLEAVKAEVKRLTDAIDRLNQCGRKYGLPGRDRIVSPKHTGAVRRASMDLTRALADLRRRPS